ncbi:Glucoamylase (glucan-1,4-alpha-glucosidase), GH15 family [Paenibacillus sp. UNCCL117]|uniref:glycoside hydrolase family 15 protein n=1 Tax=unclassified Paenibacillus TaxID=185978 RepID=UPI0008802A3D|nr:MULTISPECIES: glycoside hydrolase family 15 protein [unclassified Paenibacillus]SDC20029.1 Glucoamylase (glucan-1,4-alpha-glucosidase), GH15 family [Paenibacillus sp. cl123]SFW18534.1 Glucoamylase (glucan-1,4-alpha-glucosidase), GH15 family [Paenibacillus sp. UNCCL117]
MARDLPIGNGNVLMNFDAHYNLRDIYFPYVGQENQAIDHLSHFGVWTAEDFFWIDHPELRKQAGYLNDSMITNVECKHERLGLSLLLRDGVDKQDNVFVRKVTVANQWNRERQVKLYFHLDLHLYGNGVGDTVYYDPDLNSLVFYKGHRYMTLSCRGAEGKSSAPSSYATGQKEMNRLEGTWRDAEDGQLGRNPIAQGSVDGTIELELTLPAEGTAEAWFWVCFGQSAAEVNKLERQVREATPHALLQRTYNYWKQWLAQDRHELDLLDPELASFYKRSLLIIRAHTDNRGAIVAANDSDIMKFARDTYSYMWPRDGALISHALDRSGYFTLTRRFFNFCRKGLTEDGFLLHKYNPDGSPGSSWHPWINARGEKQFPIQEDETALVLYALWHHHRLAGTIQEARSDYESFVIPAANFMAGYKDASGLPLPSYDLWEERYGVHLFTVASVYGGLMAAAAFAEYFEDKLRALRFREDALRIKQAAEKHLYSEEAGRFIRSLYWNAERETYEPDLTLDASMYAVFDFGLVQADDPGVAATMKAIREKLWVQTEVGGLARYSNDYYHQVTKDIERVPGNPWFICTLWYAEYVIAVAKDAAGLKEAEELLRWTMAHALPSGALAEQVHPFTGEPLSVSPLTWSHASFVKVTQEYVSKLKWFRHQRKGQEDQSDEKLLTPSGRQQP